MILPYYYYVIDIAQRVRRLKRRLVTFIAKPVTVEGNKRCLGWRLRLASVDEDRLMMIILTLCLHIITFINIKLFNH